MSRLNDLIRQVGLTNETLAADLQREVAALADRRSFGLNFERHLPEAVELPGRPVRRGDKVRILPPRGEVMTPADEKLWQVTRMDRRGETPTAELVALAGGAENVRVAVDDLVVVAEFRDRIYPGLVSAGRIERGGDKPFHTVINAENYHALQSLIFTHRGKIDCIYIDPPYNTGNESWIYNDKYVAGDDYYQHSKWLAFIERRLLLARDLLAPTGALCVSIGRDEVHRLKLLIEQTFPHLIVQVITVQVTAGGKATAGVNTLADYLICATPPDFVPSPTSFTGGVTRTPWEGLVLATFNRGQRPNQAYPIFIDYATDSIHSVGASLAAQQREGSFTGNAQEFQFDVEAPPGTTAVWPITTKGEECVWRLAPDRLLADWKKGYIKVSPNRRKDQRNQFSLQYLPAGVISKVESGEIATLGSAPGVPTLSLGPNATAGAAIPSIWTESSHRTSVGNDHLKAVLGDKRFPYPKPTSLVTDIIRGFAQAGRESVVLDFFGGSGTTAEAVMHLNVEDDGTRRCIIVTNNEVPATEARRLRADGWRPGDSQWEAFGVFERVTKPRIETVVSGVRPGGSIFDEGLDQNVEFFTLTYENSLRVASHRDFERIAPLLWLRAGARGRRISEVTKGWDVADVYGVLANLDQVEAFVQAVIAQEALEVAFIVTDEDRLFESVVRELPAHVEPVRLYEAYLRNFEIESGRGLR